MCCGLQLRALAAAMKAAGGGSGFFDEWMKRQSDTVQVNITTHVFCSCDTVQVGTTCPVTLPNSFFILWLAAVHV